MSEPSFCLYLNRKKQWVEVYLWDVHPTTFYNWKGGRWGYWLPINEQCRTGLFGSLHFVKGRLRVDTISHELDHLRQSWLRANMNAWTGRNEEGVIEVKDKLLWSFLRELSKIDPRAKVWMKTLSKL